MLDLMAADAEQVLAGVESAVSRAFIAEDAARARGPHHVGLSDLFGCTRKAVYALARVAPSDTPPPDEGRAANLGTWEHNGLLPRLADELGGKHEVPVVLRAAGIELPGTADLVAPGGVLDLKTVGAYRLQTVRRKASPYQVHRGQVLAYVLATIQAGYPVRWAIWLYLDRANGDATLVIEEVTTATAFTVIDRVAELRRLAELGPDAAPIEERGPGLSLTCDGCWFLKRCWGEDAEPGMVGGQRIRVRGAVPDSDDPRAVAVLSGYADAAARESEAKADKKFYAAVIEGLRHGVYGDWEYRRDDDGEMIDQKRVRLEYETGEHSATLPTQRKRGALRIRLVRADPAKAKGRAR